MAFLVPKGPLGLGLGQPLSSRFALHGLRVFEVMEEPPKFFDPGNAVHSLPKGPVMHLKRLKVLEGGMFAGRNPEGPEIEEIAHSRPNARRKQESNLREAKPGCFQTRVFPTFISGKVQIVSRTLSGLFLVGAL